MSVTITLPSWSYIVSKILICILLNNIIVPECPPEQTELISIFLLYHSLRITSSSRMSVFVSWRQMIDNLLFFRKSKR